MPQVDLPRLEAAAIAVCCAAAAVAFVVYRIRKRRRITPEERERRRRTALASSGKITDAMLVEIREDVLFYSYLVRGVEYTASQDISALLTRMPSGLGLGVGSISVKFDARNPANSLVLAEEWSGLRGVKV
jgi:hypothetical protein